MYNTEIRDGEILFCREGELVRKGAPVLEAFAR